MTGHLEGAAAQDLVIGVTRILHRRAGRTARPGPPGADEPVRCGTTIAGRAPLVPAEPTLCEMVRARVPPCAPPAVGQLVQSEPGDLPARSVTCRPFTSRPSVRRAPAASPGPGAAASDCPRRASDLHRRRGHGESRTPSADRGTARSSNPGDRPAGAVGHWRHARSLRYFWRHGASWPTASYCGQAVNFQWR